MCWATAWPAPWWHVGKASNWLRPNGVHLMGGRHPDTLPRLPLGPVSEWATIHANACTRVSPLSKLATTLLAGTLGTCPRAYKRMTTSFIIRSKEKAKCGFGRYQKPYLA